MSKLDPTIIRVGDYIRIITPQIFIRCGYPLSKKDVQEDVIKFFGKVIEDLIYSAGHGDKFIDRHENNIFILGNTMDEGNGRNKKIYNEIVDALAYRRLIYKGYGGNERSVNVEFHKEYINAKAQVVDIKHVISGIYNRGNASYFDSYSGEYEYTPPYLSDTKTHKILGLGLLKHLRSHEETGGFIKKFSPFDLNMRIEAIHVQKITEKEYHDDNILQP